MKKLALLLTILASLNVTAVLATEHHGVLDCSDLEQSDRFTNTKTLEGDDVRSSGSDRDGAQEA